MHDKKVNFKHSIGTFFKYVFVKEKQSQVYCENYISISSVAFLLTFLNVHREVCISPVVPIIVALSVSSLHMVFICVVYII